MLTYAVYASGKASFNYRWNFELQLPMTHARLVLQAWDRDMLGNDLIGQHTSADVIIRQHTSAYVS